MKTELFRLVDQIMDRWIELEKMLCEGELKFDGFPLSIERVNGKMRICYNGRPIAECKSSEKVEAAFFLDRLADEINKKNAALILRAKSALTILEKWTLHDTDNTRNTPR